MYSDRYYDNVFRRYTSSSNSHSAPQKEKPSVYKTLLLDNRFPFKLTDGTKEYTVSLNDRCEIIFTSGEDSLYYNDVSNKFINNLKILDHG